MTDEQLNKWVHEKVMGLETVFWEHTWLIPEGETVSRCLRCKFYRGTEAIVCLPCPPPDYCNDLNLAAKAEAVVIERLAGKCGETAAAELFYVSLFAVVVKGKGIARLTDTQIIMLAVRATARQRCQAMYDVLQSDK